jgi:hypothetical protein
MGSNGYGAGNGNGAGKIPLAPLYERVNLEGRRYLVGRIGTAKLLLIETEEVSKGEKVWQSFLCQGPYAPEKVVELGRETQEEGAAR